jgi:hypothetical protein
MHEFSGHAMGRHLIMVTTHSYRFNIHGSPAIFIIAINQETVDFKVKKIYMFKFKNTNA